MVTPQTPVLVPLLLLATALAMLVKRKDKFLAWLIFCAPLVVAQDAYVIITTHHLTWSAVISTPLVLAFIVLCNRRSRWAWLIFMLFALSFSGVPLEYMSATPHAPAPAHFLAAGSSLAFGVAGFTYSLVIRKRFARHHDTI